MSDMINVNLSAIKNLTNDFKNEADNFKSNVYSNFSSSYMNTCSDSKVIEMARELNRIYKKIENGYDNILSWWIEYNENVEALENGLVEQGAVGAISESALRAIVLKMPELKVNYGLNLSNVKMSYLDGSVGEEFVNNSVDSIYKDSMYSALYKNLKSQGTYSQDIKFSGAVSFKGDAVMTWGANKISGEVFDRTASVVGLSMTTVL